MGSFLSKPMPGHLPQQHTLNLTKTVEGLCQNVLCVGTDCCEYNYSSLGGKWPGRRESIHGLVLQIPSRPRHFCRLTSGEPACPPQAPLLLQHSVRPLLLLGATLTSHQLSRSYSSEGGQVGQQDTEAGDKGMKSKETEESYHPSSRLGSQY